MKYDTIVIGTGLSGLSAAALLAKRGLHVAVMEQASKPGGACGIFKRNDALFDQGAAMLYGFGDHGFNAHRFLFNCLEEPIHMIRHDLLYVVHYKGRKIRFMPDVDAFILELSSAFPQEACNIRKFYGDMQKLYSHVISQTPSYTTPDETNPREALRSVMKHPISYGRFLYFLNISARKLLEKYFTDPDLLEFFDKLTSTYCYTTAKETPAVLASVMFIDNHEGGSYYPAGSTLFLPGKLEKVIEENGGHMHYDTFVSEILFDGGSPCGVRTENGASFYGRQIIYAGTVWNLYQKLIPSHYLEPYEIEWASSQIPTLSSLVFYALVKNTVIPNDTCPIEMLASASGNTDESEVTIYIMSLDDHTLCPDGYHTVVAIGPTLRHWNREDRLSYETMKKEEMRRITEILEMRFPGFTDNIVYNELATPETIERFTCKNFGAAAGPKQMLGQHMLLRQSIRTKWDTLFCCGESTTMGTGTPTVTTSGIAAANAVLKKHHKKPYVWDPKRPNYVQVTTPPVEMEWQYGYYPDLEAKIMILAGKCLFCTEPSCCSKDKADIPGIMRRTACGNFSGAAGVLRKYNGDWKTDSETWEEKCVRNRLYDEPVPVSDIIGYLTDFIDDKPAYRMKT